LSMERVPPGQLVTKKFPVLTYGATPKFDSNKWAFQIIGLVENEIKLSYQELRELPRTEAMADFHCVTQWSRLDNRWGGIAMETILELTKPLVEATHVMAHCDGGYTTNLPIDVIADDDVLLAYEHDGVSLAPEHGWPLRLIVPKRYAWKSAKWLRALEFMNEDRPGFWEMHGYHNDADPWSEERFS